MPKAYWIAHATVLEPISYARYANGASAAFAEFGGRPLARGGRFEQLEGAPAPRNVVIEFDDFETALACYNSDIYQAAKFHRETAGRVSITIVEGSA